MEELERLKRKVENATELQSIVKIMKAISAANIREYGQAVESLEAYESTIEMGLQILMRSRLEDRSDVFPKSGGKAEKSKLGAVIFGSDQGLIGKFNENISSFALSRMNEMEKEFGFKERSTVAVGERVVARLEEAGQKIDNYFSFSGNVQGVTKVMQNVLVKIEQWRLEGGVDQIVLFYNRPVSGSSFDPQMVYLYPLDVKWLESLAGKKWRSKTLPTFTMNPDRLFASLVNQYLFITLYRAFVESLASENASRLMSMQLAERNIEEHLHELTVQFQRQRQTAITSELLDIVTGYEALTGGKG